MKRLTSDKPVSEMSMYELAYNSCYAKDERARVRDFKNDFDARELTIKLLEKYADIPNEFTFDDDFEDFMFDSLQYGTDSILGLIAVFYRNLWVMANLREWLKEYEDLEEQGKLLKLPCKLGDTTFWISDEDEDGNKIPTIRENNPIVGIAIQEDGMYILSDGDEEYQKAGTRWCFLAREEAEAALKKL